MAAFHASSLHVPSSLVFSATESDNSSEDELPFDENIPLAGYEQRYEEEDEEAISGFLARNKKSSNTKKKKTSNYNIRLTVKRKRIFCCISFLRLLEFCKSFPSSNLC